MLTVPIAGVGDLDELVQKAVEVVVQYDRASASLLQRRLGIGYARAARVMDQLVAAGVVGPHSGAKPADVLVKSYDEFVAHGGVASMPYLSHKEWLVPLARCISNSFLSSLSTAEFKENGYPGGWVTPSFLSR